jgi:hypothetical protein
MTTRQELLTQWQQRLAEAEQACLAADSPVWADRVRVKLYRFLLSMYGHAPWPGAKDDVDNSRGRAASQITVADPKEELAGKEPRTRAEILRGLRNVKGLGEELAPAGPLQGGLQPDSPMVIASYKRRPAAEVALDRLRRAGLCPAMVRQGKLWQIYVTADGFDIASQCLQLRERAVPRLQVLTVSRGPGIITLLSSIFFLLLACVMCGLLVQMVFLDQRQLAEYDMPARSELTMYFAFEFLMLLIAYVLYRSWSNAHRADRERLRNEPAPGRDPR